MTEEERALMNALSQQRAIPDLRSQLQGINPFYPTPVTTFLPPPQPVLNKKLLLLEDA